MSSKAEVCGSRLNTWESMPLDDFEEGDFWALKPVAVTYDENFNPSSLREVHLTSAAKAHLHQIPLKVSSHSFSGTSRRTIVRLCSASDLKPRTLFDGRVNQVVISSIQDESHVITDLKPKESRSTLLKAAFLTLDGTVEGITSFEFNPALAEEVSINLDSADGPPSPTRLSMSVRINSVKKEQFEKKKQQEARRNSASSLFKQLSISERLSLRWRMMTSSRKPEVDEEE